MGQTPIAGTLDLPPGEPFDDIVWLADYQGRAWAKISEDKEGDDG